MVVVRARAYKMGFKCPAHDDLGQVQARDEHLQDGVLRRRGAGGPGAGQRLGKLVGHVGLPRQRRRHAAQVPVQPMPWAVAVSTIDGVL